MKQNGTQGKKICHEEDKEIRPEMLKEQRHDSRSEEEEMFLRNTEI